MSRFKLQEASRISAQWTNAAPGAFDNSLMVVAEFAVHSCALFGDDQPMKTLSLLPVWRASKDEFAAHDTSAGNTYTYGDGLMLSARAVPGIAQSVAI